MRGCLEGGKKRVLHRSLTGGRAELSVKTAQVGELIDNLLRQGGGEFFCERYDTRPFSEY